MQWVQALLEDRVADTGQRISVLTEPDRLQGSSRGGGSGAAEEGDDDRVYEDPFEDEFGQEDVLEDVGEEGYGAEGQVTKKPRFSLGFLAT